MPQVRDAWSTSLRPDRGPEEELRRQQEAALSHTYRSASELNQEVFGRPGGLEPTLAPVALPESIRALKGVNVALMETVGDVAARYAAKADQVWPELRCRLVSLFNVILIVLIDTCFLWLHTRFIIHCDKISTM